ncbi:unnamed protein product [Scytosiphon promiscuus]
MHGNSSARVEALPQLSLALSLGTTLVAFDFAGSGKSGGEHVSLGYYERDDLKAVIEHLRKSGQVSAIALWGRSMGAATALLHGDRDPSIAALVLDSAFADLTQLAEEMVERGREAGLTVPGIVVKMVMRMIRGTVAKTANFNVRDLCPIKHADRTFIPALFVAGLSDDFIKPHHSKQICEAYAGDKNYITVNGDHNSPRPGFLFDSVYIFLQLRLQVPPEWGLDRENSVMGFPPWHYASGGSRGAATAAMYGAAAAATARSGSSGGGGGGGGGSDLDPDFADYDWDGIGVDDVDVDGVPSVGMTRARQAEFQTALFHMLAQERTDQSPHEAGGESSGERRPPAAAPSPSSRTFDRRNQSSSATSSGMTADVRGNGNVDRGARGALQRDAAGDAVGVREGELLVGVGGKPGPTEERLLVEEEEQGAEAVAAVAATLKAAGATPVAATAAQAGFATPSAASRPMMAPFSVSDASDLEDSMSPVDSLLRQSGRGSATAAEPVAEGDDEDDEEGGVEGVAEVGSAMDARGHGAAAVAAAAAAAAVEGFSSPLSAEAGDDESFFDARDTSATTVVEEGNVGARGRRRRSDDGKTPVGYGGAGVGIGRKSGETPRDDGERDSLSGDDGGWHQAVGVVASPENIGLGARDRGWSNAEDRTGSSGWPRRGGGYLASEADRGWSCSKCTLRNDAGVRFCLACTSPRVTG